MKKIVSYELELNLMSPRKWEGYLKQHSGLPGTSLNLRLAKAFSEIGSIIDFKKFAQFQPKDAPENTPDAFLVFCGVLGLGNYLSKYADKQLFLTLKKLSNDSRKSIRQAVVIALKTVGQKDKDKLIKELQAWVDGSLLEQHATIQAFCDHKAKISIRNASQILDMLDLITVNLLDSKSRDKNLALFKNDLSRCWSVIVAAYPRKGKTLIEHWVKENNPVTNQIMNTNLKILKPLEPDWAEAQLSKLVL